MAANKQGSEKKWFACYTKPRAEKSTYKRLLQAGIETFLPLRKERRKWSDRLKTVTVPLFTSYIFVNIEEHLQNKVRIEGQLVGFIVFEGKAVAIPSAQIEAIRKIASVCEELDVVPSGIEPGEKIEVIAGRLMGIKGELIRHHGAHKVLVRLDEIGQGVLFELDRQLIAPRL